MTDDISLSKNKCFKLFIDQHTIEKNAIDKKLLPYLLFLYNDEFESCYQFVQKYSRNFI